MLVDRVLRNIALDSRDEVSGRAIDRLVVSWEDCLRRAFRGQTEGGIAVSVLLPIGITLRHGDVLFEDADRTIVASVRPVEVLVATPPTTRHLGEIASELGNLHQPVELTEAGEVVCLSDGPTVGVLRRCGVPFRIEMRRFAPLRSSVLNGWTFSKDGASPRIVRSGIRS